MRVKRIVRVAVVGTTVAAAVTAAAALGGPLPGQQIDFGDSFFEPANPPPTGVDPGAREVAWIGPGTTLSHNVHQDKRLFRSGNPSPDFHEYQTDIAAGKYHYYCQVHGSKSGGMDGVVKIRPTVTAPAPGAESITVIWADSEAEPKHRYRVEFRRAGSRKWKVWKKGTAQPEGQFGANDKPIDASLTRDYQLRVRTFVKGKKKRRSGWSPRLTFNLSI